MNDKQERLVIGALKSVMDTDNLGYAQAVAESVLEQLGLSVEDAIQQLKPLARRWETTPQWHDPPFLIGTIEITTGDLRALSTLLRHLDYLNTPVKDGDEFLFRNGRLERVQ